MLVYIDAAGVIPATESGQRVGCVREDPIGRYIVELAHQEVLKEMAKKQAAAESPFTRNSRDRCRPAD